MKPNLTSEPDPRSPCSFASTQVLHGAKLGVDLGTVRIGVAACDRDELVVLPVQTVRRTKDGRDLQKVAQIALDREVVEIVIGLPKHLRGTEGKSAHLARQFARSLAKRLPEVRVCLLDERLTSVSAHSRLSAAGKDHRSSRQMVDQVAAQIILESALQMEKIQGKPAGEQVS